MDERDSFEDKLRWLAKEVSRTVEQAAEQIDLDELAERIGMSGERFREFADVAGQWLSHQFDDATDHAEADVAGDPAASHAAADTWGAPPTADEVFAPPGPAARPPRRTGPHPLDRPTEEQGLALSALDSGRWRVEPGTNEMVSRGEGPDPLDAVGLVGELRARDWIAASGELTLAGREALKRWLERQSPS